MILEVDAGNSRVKWRVVDFAEHQICRGAVAEWSEGLLRNCGGVRLERARIASVRSDLANQFLAKLLEQEFGVYAEFAVSSGELGGVFNGYRIPEKLGVDRWLAMLSACKRWPEEDLLIVDSGSAVTLDIVNREGVHLGGYIVPGLRLQLDSLARGTTLPGFLSPGSEVWEPGRDTEAAIRRGVSRMLSAWVVEEARTRFDGGARVVVTGGDGRDLSKHLQIAGFPNDFVEDLVLDGLQIALP
jgi:type III pantothenate kinase